VSFTSLTLSDTKEGDFFLFVSKILQLSPSYTTSMSLLLDYVYMNICIPILSGIQGFKLSDKIYQ